MPAHIPAREGGYRYIELWGVAVVDPSRLCLISQDFLGLTFTRRFGLPSCMTVPGIRSGLTRRCTSCSRGNILAPPLVRASIEA